jgi:hypothetical protein
MLLTEAHTVYPGKKTSLRAVYTRNQTLAKTGSGQTRKNSKKEGVFSYRTRDGRVPHLLQVRNRGVFAPFIYKNDDFTKTGSGQT